jgi:hypothetical protein
MNADASIVDQSDLAQNLQQLADNLKMSTIGQLEKFERPQEGRLRRIAIHHQQNDLSWFALWLRLPPTRSGMRLWWLAPASWAVVFFIAFLVTDWFWDAFGQFLGRMGL